jgi:bacterioferritin-associated ferredoxin
MKSSQAGAAMYVCLCKGITDRQIREAISEGASSMRDLRSALDVANQCGKCGRDCKALLSENLIANNPLQGAQYVAA